jgi:hypothetical protein
VVLGEARTDQTLLVIEAPLWRIYMVRTSILYTEGNNKICSRATAHSRERNLQHWRRFSHTPHVLQLLLSNDARESLAGGLILRDWLHLAPKTLATNSLKKRLPKLLAMIETPMPAGSPLLNIWAPFFAMDERCKEFVLATDGVHQLNALKRQQRYKDVRVHNESKWDLLLAFLRQDTIDVKDWIAVTRSCSYVEDPSMAGAVPDMERSAEWAHSVDALQQQRTNARRTYWEPNLSCAAICGKSPNIVKLVSEIERMHYGISEKSLGDLSHWDACLRTHQYPLGVLTGGRGGTHFVYPGDVFYAWHPVFSSEVAVGPRWMAYQAQFAERFTGDIYTGINGLMERLGRRRKVAESAAEEPSRSAKQVRQLGVITLHVQYEPHSVSDPLFAATA